MIPSQSWNGYGMVAIDNSVLTLLLHPKARPPLDPATKKPIERLPDRIEKLIEALESDNQRIIIPTPALSEFLVLAGNQASEYLDVINARHMFLVRPFDEMAAIELAAFESEQRASGTKRGGISAPWNKVKFDRQIVVIAKTNDAKRIYSDDDHVRAFATKMGIETISSWELTLPAAKQTEMFETHEQIAVEEPLGRAVRTED
jgi:predicted nucleic acid-binding protein